MPPEGNRPGGIGAAVAAAERRARNSLLRNHGGGHAPVSNLELFFDLVFVFAITQLSHFVGHHLNPLGFVEGLMLFLALWWGWMYTTWVTNWLNPDRLPVRVMLLVLMLLSLGMAVSLPDAFADKALPFALCYVAIQLGRTLCTAAMFQRERAHNTRNMVRIAVWFAASAPLWIAGALAGGAIQFGCWIAALAIEYLGPFALYRVPLLGRSKPSEWDISGSHMAERCALFIIIALGEGIVVTGATMASTLPSLGMTLAFVTAFAGSALLWWLYFDMGAVRGAQFISGHSQVGRVARNAFTYLHMPIVLGVVILAVGDAMLMERWDHPADLALIAVQTFGMLTFLIGLGLFKRFGNTIGNFPLSHMIAILLAAALGLWAWWHPPGTALFANAGVAILLLTAVWEWVSYHGGWMERLERLGVPYPERMRTSFEKRRIETEQKRG